MLLHGVNRRNGRRTDCRYHAHDQHGHAGDGDREQQHRRVDRQVERHRVDVGRDLPHKEGARPSCDGEAERGPGGGEHRALGEQLPHEAPSRGADRRAYAQLVTSRGRAGEEQVRDVGAGDKEHERDNAEDDEQRTLVAASQLRRAGRCVDERPRRPEKRILRAKRRILRHGRLANLGLDRAERGGRALDRLPR